MSCCKKVYRPPQSALRATFEEPMSTADTFHSAARRGDFAECRRLLGLDKELVHSRDGGGRTLLHHWAALDPSQEQASCAALTWARTYEVELDAVNDKTGAWCCLAWLVVLG